MAKKLAVFCDGTWQDLRCEFPTNVVRLARSVSHHDPDGTPQIVYYDEGIGVAPGVNRFVDFGVKLIGGALGNGLDQKIMEAYLFLVLNYKPGDEIYVFGFSRGAHTARSLCGLIRKCGVLRREFVREVPSAIEHYRSVSNPKSAEMVDFRQRYAHRKASGSEDLRRMGEPVETATPSTESLAKLYQYRPDESYRLMYLGVWDTVGALGIPKKYRLWKIPKRYSFYDTDASSLLASIRHAVAANEKRHEFDATTFANLRTLNLEWAKRTGWNVSDPDDERFVPYRLRPYQQQWFAGDHGAVGGGCEETKLSDIVLTWIAEGAANAGLALDYETGSELAEARRRPSPLGPLGNNATTGDPGGRDRRKGPEHLENVSLAVRERYARDPKSYDPPNLSLMRGQTWPETERPAPTGFPTH